MPDRTSTKQRVIEVATRILEQEGAEAVSVRRIAAEVGVTPMALYRHFPNREELLAHVATASFAQAARQWALIERPTLVEAADALIDFALARPRLYEFMFTARREGARQYPEDFREGRSPTGAILAAAIERDMAAGRLRNDDVHEVALTLSAQLHGLIQLYHGGRINLTEPQFRALCHRCLDRIREGIAG
ncbi:TetR/AcrR family transcriptional regulator [Catellatospora sp. KI3]|uniref:TetR/AcrR family transcriptional regulator n=1 Tax=Catellatospora sp. KI3 TaxID=3041620 RepID=UPI00248301F7|nr:TetR/AcrR family transcriptional regulator [Catellatospora sp. KI3]MDI1463535.1 TetR/AcrR family transcriptional regulator [Catellatospora sp. KI3]